MMNLPLIAFKRCPQAARNDIGEVDKVGFAVEHDLRLDFEELELNEPVIAGQSSKGCEYYKSFVFSTFHHEEL